MNDKEELLEILRKEYRKETDYIIVSELPAYLKFKIDNDKLFIKIADDVSLFDNNYQMEGWFLIFYRWGIFNKIIIEWNSSKLSKSINYACFLKRIALFSINFSRWFSISEKNLSEISNLTYEEINNISTKSFLESIINTTWYFEINERINFVLPKFVNVSFSTGDVILNFDNKSLLPLSDGNKDHNFKFRIESIIKRWAYLQCLFNGENRTIVINEEQEKLYQKLIDIGYKDREIVVPYIINN